MNKVHGPDLVGSGRRRAIVPQLRLDAALGRFVAQLQADFTVQPAHPLAIDQPALAPQQHMNAAISVADAGLGDLLDSLHQNSLPGAFGSVVIGRPVDR